MAPNIIKRSEVVFFSIILMLFCLIISKYYGESIFGGISRSISKMNTFRTYNSYKVLAKDVQAVENNVGFEKSVPILVYHGVVTTERKNDEAISLDNFRDQMFALKKNGYQTISIDDYYQFIHCGKEIPSKSFVLTFDDGRKDSYYPTDPILKALDFKATMFVITGTLSQEKTSPYYLSLDELKKMIASGRWDIQSHGQDAHGFVQIDADGNSGRFMSHKKWLVDTQRIETNEEYRDRILKDLINSKKDLKDYLGVDATAYALPAGDYGHKNSNYLDAEKVIHDVIREAFPMTFYQFSPGWQYGYYSQNHIQNDSDQYFFRRIKVFGNYDAKKLLNILDAGHETNIPYINDFSNEEKWIVGWGNLKIDDGILTLQNDRSNNAAIFLDGSFFWDNYSFNTNTRLVTGTNSSLLARVENGNNFVGCTFEDKAIKLFVVEDGVIIPLGETILLGFDVGKDNNVGIEVKDDVVECLLGNISVLRSTLNNKHITGGVGYMVYSENKNIPAVLNITGPNYFFEPNENHEQM